jgi:DNA-binding transcriptional regulator YdaS (Cro superfamily)
MSPGFERIVSTRGMAAHIARELGLSAASLSQWRKRQKIPAEQVLAVERVTGIPKEELRPDLYLPKSEGGTNGVVDA